MSKLAVWLYILTYRGMGGWERYVQCLLKHLPQYNTDIFVIDTLRSKLVLENQQRIRGALEVPLEPISRSAIYLDYVYLYLYSLSKKFEINVLHIPSQADIHILRIIHAKHYVLTIHGLSLLLFRKVQNILRYKLLLKLAKHADTIITVSEWTKNLITKYLEIDPSSVHVIYNCVDRSVFNENSSKLDEKILGILDIDKPYFLHVSTGSITKNPYLIVKAASIANLATKDVLLVFVGFSGDSARLIKQLASLRGVSNVVRVLPPIKDDRILAALYRNAEAFILPSFIENCPFSLLEAMSCGCVCIVSNRAALPEIGGDAVLYINSFKPTELAELMIQILRDEYRYLKRRAVERVTKLFIPKVFAEKHVKVYKQVYR